MASISIRKLDDKVYERLRLRAAKHGVSMEEEVRQIVSQAVLVPERISDVFRQHFGHNMGVDLDAFFQNKKPHNPMDFET
jgi:plasmid stability protein